MNALATLAALRRALTHPRNPQTFTPAGNGQSALLAFPRFPDLRDDDALGALDEWLGDHPSCGVVLVNELPSGRTLRRLQGICDRRGCALMVRASKSAVTA